MQVTIGLFGTCGDSKWRDAFIKTYQEKGIQYFNPQVEDWDPSFAEIEAEHLANDQIILFPVTSETYGSGSLTEVGFSILQAIRMDDRRDFVVLIDMDLDDSLDDTVARKESLRSRALVKQHLKKLRLKNLYLVNTMEEMQQVSILLHGAALIHNDLRRYNPHINEI